MRNSMIRLECEICNEVYYDPYTELTHNRRVRITDVINEKGEHEAVLHCIGCDVTEIGSKPVPSSWETA